jgi:antitoxin (DNA-binding transcriptional repressor) of toxin-antitoxin stability system
MKTIDIDQAQSQISQLLQAAINGEEIIITRDNLAVLKLSPISSPPKYRHRGSAKGQIQFAPDFDEPLEDFQEYME